MKSLYVLLAILFAAPALAQTPPSCLAPVADPVPRNSVRWSWTAPTTNTDGSAVKTPITYTVYEGTNKVCTTNGTASSWNNLSVGTHSWTVTSTTSDGESAQSNVVSKNILPAPPNPPTGFKVDPASLTAYSPVKQKDTMQILAVGSVPPGTSCDTTQGVVVNGVTYYVVPSAAVMPANPGATAIVAKCT